MHPQWKLSLQTHKILQILIGSPTMLTITRKLEFDAGHRIPDHASQCRKPARLLPHPAHHVDGRRGAAGTANRQRHDHGLWRHHILANANLVDKWDHAFIVYEKTTAVRAFPGQHAQPQDQEVIDRVPTVENLARAALILKDVLPRPLGCHLSLTKVTLYETPNCWAEIDG